MYRSFKPEEQIDGPLLWRAWAEMEWEEGNDETALKVLVASTAEHKVDLGTYKSFSMLFRTDTELERATSAASLAKSSESRPSSTEILRARRQYPTQLEASFQPLATQTILRNRNHLAFSAALLAYLTQGLDEAVEVLERQLFRLDSPTTRDSAELEEVYMLYAKLLYRHSTKGGYKPGQLRDLLERAIRDFKNNTLFLGLFYHNECMSTDSRRSSPSE